MPDYDRRADDEWRGQIAARVKSIEDRLVGQDARAAVLGESITSIRVDMSATRAEQIAMREDVQEIAAAVKEDAKARAQERAQDRTDRYNELQATVRQKGLNRFQWTVLGAGAFLTAIAGPLVVAALTGHLG